MAQSDVLDGLIRSRERLTDMKNWCPAGSGWDGAYCAMVTPYHVCNCWSDVKRALADACETLFQTRHVSFINDGICGFVTHGMSAKERHKIILQIYDTAIEQVKSRVNT